MSKEFSIGALRARDNFEMSRSDIVVKMVERMEIYAVVVRKWPEMNRYVRNCETSWYSTYMLASANFQISLLTL